MSLEPCQCPDCQNFYKEHDRLIRQYPTLRQQQEINWASLQSFRTLCTRVLEDLQKDQAATNLEEKNQDSNISNVIDENPTNDINHSIADLENINAYLFSIEALMERVFDVKVPEVIENKFKELAGEIAPDPLGIDRLRLNRLLHQTPDSKDKNSDSI